MSESIIFFHDAKGPRTISREEHEAMREELEKGQAERQQELDELAKETRKRDADKAMAEAYPERQQEGPRSERWGSRPGAGPSTLERDLRGQRTNDSSSRG